MNANPSTATEAVTEPAEQPFPFTTPDGSDASMFIQWKGTDVCLDFYCTCGTHGHFDGDFAYHLRCTDCGAVYELGTQVIARRVADDVPHARNLDTPSDPA